MGVHASLSFVKNRAQESLLSEVGLKSGIQSKPYSQASGEINCCKIVDIHDNDRNKALQNLHWLPKMHSA